MIPDLLLVDRRPIAPVAPGTLFSMTEQPGLVTTDHGPLALHVAGWDRVWVSVIVDTAASAGIADVELQWWSEQPTGLGVLAPTLNDEYGANAHMVGRVRHGVIGPDDVDYSPPLPAMGYVGLEVCEPNRGPWLSIAAQTGLAVGGYHVRVGLTNVALPRFPSPPAILCNPNPLIAAGGNKSFLIPSNYRGPANLQVNGPAASGVIVEVIDRLRATVGYAESYNTGAGSEFRVVELPPGLLRLTLFNNSGAPANIGASLIPLRGTS